jgi:hypothetical protein
VVVEEVVVEEVDAWEEEKVVVLLTENTDSVEADEVVEEEEDDALEVEELGFTELVEMYSTASADPATRMITITATVTLPNPDLEGTPDILTPGTLLGNGKPETPLL